LPLLFALLAIAARLPFLVSGKIAFDSDEAVEGLMARHVLNGELPAFFWGQAFKGVPEVYAAAGAFAVFGSSVTVLKSVTLAFFAAFVALNFALVDRIAGRWMAVVTCLLLIVSPPALVFWSLDASAEYVVIMLLGTLLLLLCLRLEDARREEGRGKREERLLGAIGLVIGIGLWVHQIFVFYLLPALVILGFQSHWRERLASGHLRLFTRALAMIAAIYLTLSVVAFMTGGFALQLGSITLGARAPQKLLRIAVGVAALAVLSYAIANVSRGAIRKYARRYWPLAAGYLAGYSPVILYSLFIEPARSPARNADLSQLMKAAPDIFGNVIPILSGFKIATTERLDIPLAAAAIIVAALATYLLAICRRLAEVARHRVTTPTLAADFFPLFVILVPLMFIVSGAYLDTQSYRYLIPYYAGLAVALAAGSLALAKGDKNIASVFVAMILVVFGLQQWAWYQKLTPDSESVKTLECLKREGIRGGYADYWTSYKLTFLSNEDIIFAPTNGVDRYPAYTEFVRGLPEHQRVTSLADCGVSH
jgi:4-amino-4-deoxy-L-arabinose transferase-like glycosyltransferase